MLLSLLAGALLAFGAWTVPAEAQDREEGTWSPGGRLGDIRGQSDTATRLPDGRVLLVGGDSAELWDPDTRESRLTNPPQNNHRGHTATLLDDGRVLVAGGSGNASAEVYEPDTEQWTSVPSMAYERTEHTATLLDDGRVLVVGGRGLPAAEEPDSASSDLHSATTSVRFRFVIDETGLDVGETVTINLDAPQAGSFHFSSDDDLYSTYGGEVTATTTLDTAQLTFTATQAIEAGTRITVSPRRGAVTTEWVAEQYRVVFTRNDTGGTARTTIDTGAKALGSAEVYDPGQNQWSTVEAPGQARRHPAATRLADGRVLVTGGYGNPVRPVHGEGDADITDVAGERIKPRYESSQSFAFAIVGSDLPAGGQVTINLDDAQAGHPTYADDDSLWTSAHGEVTVTVGADTAELTFTAAEPVPAGTRVTVQSGRGALATDAEFADWYDAVFTRNDTGGSQTTSFLMGPVAHDSAEIFDPGAGTWEPAATMHAARGSSHSPEHTAHLLGDGRVVTVGRSDDGPPAEFYHPDSNEWQPCDSDNPDVPDCPIYPDQRRPVGSLLNDGTVLVAGYTSATRSPTAQRFDPQNGEWWAADDPEGFVYGHPSALLDNGHVFVAINREPEVYSPQTVPAPVVESISPTQGPANGGFEMTITGQNLADAIYVTFGELDRRVGEVTQVSPTEIRVTAPTHPDGFALVRVATPGGLSESEATHQVEFVASDGAWDPTGDMAQAGRSGSVLLDGPACQDPASAPDHCGRVLFADGTSSQLYDPETGRFGSVASIPVSHGLQDPVKRMTPLDGPACRGEEPADYCGKVLALERRDLDKDEYAAEMALYDPATNEWQGCAQADADFDCPPSLERPDEGGLQWEATTLIDGAECHDPEGSAPAHCGKVLASVHKNARVPEMFLFDPATGQWEETSPPSEKREMFPMTLVEGSVCESDNPPEACGDVLITSGTTFVPGGGEATRTAELYDPSTGQWRDTQETPPSGVEEPTATTLPDGRVLIAGGFIDYDGPQSDAAIFDPRGESWRPLPDMPDRRQAHGAAALPDGRVMIAGGIVRTPGGSDNPSSSVLVFDLQEGEWSYTDSLLDARKGEERGDRGHFPLVALRDGRVLAAGGRGAETSAELYTLQPGSVAGLVLDAGTGDPIEGAEVTVTDADGTAVGSATTGAEGTYQVSGVPFGSYAVTAEAAGYEAASQDGVTVDAGEATRLDFALAESTTGGGGAVQQPQDGLVAGVVTDAESGQTLEGVEVAVEGPTTASTTTDAEGAYQLAGLAAGSYTVTANAAGYEAASQVVEVVEGEAATADFALQPEAAAAGAAGSVAGTVTDAGSGDPVAGAEVTVTDTAGSVVVSAGTDTSGAYTAEGLAPGDYTLTAEATGYEAASQSVTVAAGETAAADFALQPVTDGDQPVDGEEPTTALGGDLTSAELVQAACDPAAVPDAGFGDIGGSVHEDSVACVAWYGLTLGLGDLDGDGQLDYGPNRPVTRDQMASFIARLAREAGVDLPADAPDAFGDDDGSVHEDNINALAAANITQGVGETQYVPRNPVSRDQMASFLARLAGEAGLGLPEEAPDAFGDDDGSVHEDNINALAAANITRGVSEGVYAPRNPVSRGQMASFLGRLLGGFVESGIAPEGGAEVSLDSTSTAAGGQLAGEVFAHKDVTSLTADGCGLSERELSVDAEGSFAVPVPADQAAGDCELAFAVSTTRGADAPVQTARYGFAVTVEAGGA